MQRAVRGVEELTDAPCGLADALFVLDKGDADEFVAVLAEPMPGATATSAFSTRSLENSRLPRGRNFSGIRTQANIEAVGGGMTQPALPKESISTSRRRL